MDKIMVLLIGVCIISPIVVLSSLFYIVMSKPWRYRNFKEWLRHIENDDSFF